MASISTCPVDNWLMTFQVLVKSGRIDLYDLACAGDVIRTAPSLKNMDMHVPQQQCLVITY